MDVAVLSFTKGLQELATDKGNELGDFVFAISFSLSTPFAPAEQPASSRQGRQKPGSVGAS